MMIRGLTLLLCSALVLVVSVSSALAQKSIAEVLGREATPQGQPKTLLEEIMLFSYLESSYVWNLGVPSRRNVNELRFYDADAQYTFNAAELSIKKDPSDRYPYGFGAVITAGEDSQKNHALGIFRDGGDRPPYYRSTPKYDLVETYGSWKIPLGSGLTLKAGKWATLTGFEVYESPKNLNFSRSFLYTLGTPYTHVGVLLSYQFTPWLGVTAGFINGWDKADNNNGKFPSAGQLSLTPLKDFSANLNWIVGPEQERHQGADHYRWLLDWVLNYTGIPKVTLGLNADVAGEEREPTLVAARTRRDTDVMWWGYAAYGGYDWTKALRTVLRLEYFADPDGVRSGIVTPGKRVSLWEVTGTVQYTIWKGLVGRLEYRHDSANRKTFSVHGGGPTASTQDTLTLALYYSFF